MKCLITIKNKIGPLINCAANEVSKNKNNSFKITQILFLNLLNELDAIIYNWAWVLSSTRERVRERFVLI